ncbi:MAG TPA: serine hydrolase domain-containing protein [Thermoanaerobaculia bacterium]|nr:serine hydrolase domain-containing protein [Thermoanaerobaculia bacterium]
MPAPRSAAVLLFLLLGCAAPGLVLEAPAPEAAATTADASQPESSAPAPSAERLDAYLSRLETLGFSGAVIVDHEGEVVLRKGYGLADRESRRPYTPETVQTHGSITKQVTAAAILLLESRGELSVDDLLGEHFDAVPADKRGITLHHLLTHTAGFPGGIGPDRQPIGADAFVELALAAPLEVEPGAEFRYSNVGYSLLGIVVERVSGRGYEELVREELLLPAGLAETGYLLPTLDERRLAVGYDGGERWGRVHGRGWREDGPGWNLRANGGLHTTVDDMRRWLAVLRGEGPLPAAAVERWTTGHVDTGDESFRYGYGWMVAETELGRAVAHNGGNGVFSAFFVWLPETELFLYIHGNSSLFYPADMLDSLLGALFDSGFELPPAVAAEEDVEPARAAAREGEYRVEGGRLTLTADDVRLLAAVSGQPVLDAVLGHDPARRERFAGLNAKAAEAMRRLRAGREDAFAGLVGEGEDAVAPARRMLARIQSRGELRSLELVGSVANVPGTRFADDGPWTTFFRAEHGGETYTWSVLWREDGSYRGTAIGPPTDVPGFILVPAGDAACAGVEREPPWRRADFRFEHGCLLVGGLTACR